MKSLYWRPPGVSRAALLLIASVSVVALSAAEHLKVRREQPYYEVKLQAARLAERGMQAIKAEKRRLGIHPDLEIDPADTGMIGEAITPVTANTGYLLAKRRSVDPNFAAIMVELLERAGVERGDKVAVGVSGSFPALNVATFAALTVLQVEPVVIASTSASEWGANHVEYLWLDMERTLEAAHLIGFRSIAASLGGIDDRGYGMSKEGRQYLERAVERAHIPLISVTGLTDSVEQRMAIYQEHAGGRAYKAYINVGGGAASVGTHVGKKQFKPGLNTSPPRGAALMDSVMYRFALRDVPVIHVTSIDELAKHYELAAPPPGKAPVVGQGGIYAKLEYRRWLAALGLVVVLATMVFFIRSDRGHRLLRVRGRVLASDQPQKMI